MDTAPTTTLPTQRYANQYLYSDIVPFEVTRVVSDRTIDVRRMISVRDPSWKPEIIPGGFSGHCTNNTEQRWFFESDPTFHITRIRRSKKGANLWRDKYGNNYVLSDAPRRFHDYNF